MKDRLPELMFTRALTDSLSAKHPAFSRLAGVSIGWGPVTRDETDGRGTRPCTARTERGA
jgi:hypothetical protein